MYKIAFLNIDFAAGFLLQVDRIAPLHFGKMRYAIRLHAFSMNSWVVPRFFMPFFIFLPTEIIVDHEN